MGQANNDDAMAVEKGEEHLSARIDEDSYRRIRIAAAERDESIAEFLRNSVTETLAQLEEGNQRMQTAAASS
jgi:uncharacterized protein (DUF1778 family)